MPFDGCGDDGAPVFLWVCGGGFVSTPILIQGHDVAARSRQPIVCVGNRAYIATRNPGGMFSLPAASLMGFQKVGSCCDGISTRSRKMGPGHCPMHSSKRFRCNMGVYLPSQPAGGMLSLLMTLEWSGRWDETRTHSCRYPSRRHGSFALRVEPGS